MLICFVKASYGHGRIKQCIVMHGSHGSKALYMYPLFFFQCPVFDLVRNVEFSGEYQTVTKKGAITVTVRKFFCFQYGEGGRVSVSHVRCYVYALI